MLYPLKSSNDHDPFARLLRDKLQFGKTTIVIGAVIVTAVVLVGGSLVTGKPFHKVYDGFYDTMDSLRKAFGLIPLAVVIYLLLPDSIAGLFNTIQKNHIIGEPHPGKESFSDLLGKYVRVARSRSLVVGAFLIVLIHLAYRMARFGPHLDRPLWREIVTDVLVYSPALYGALIGIGQLIVVLVFIRILFNSYIIEVKPLHPDGCGGLSALGRMLKISIIGASVLAVVVAIGLHLPAEGDTSGLHRLEPWALLLIYVIVIPLLFVVLLWLPHSAMIKARDSALGLRANIARKGDELDEIERQNRARDAFPIWPIKIALLSRLGLLVAASLVNVVVNAVLKK